MCLRVTGVDRAIRRTDRPSTAMTDSNVCEASRSRITEPARMTLGCAREIGGEQQGDVHARSRLRIDVIAGLRRVEVAPPTKPAEPSGAPNCPQQTSLPGSSSARDLLSPGDGHVPGRGQRPRMRGQQGSCQVGAPWLQRASRNWRDATQTSSTVPKPAFVSARARGASVVVAPPRVRIRSSSSRRSASAARLLLWPTTSPGLAAGAAVPVPRVAGFAERDRSDQQSDDRICPPPAGNGVGEQADQQRAGEIGAEHRLAAFAGGGG